LNQQTWCNQIDVKHSYKMSRRVNSQQGSHIYMCEFKNGSYLAPVVLSFNGKPFRALDPVVANDEHFIIFLANQPGGGGLDLWVSFKKAGAWGEPINVKPGDKNYKPDDQRVKIW
jgi:hypothetical protein